MKSFKMLSKAEMRKIGGGNGLPCMVDADCPGGMCINGECGGDGGPDCVDNCGGTLGSCPRSDEVCKTSTCITSDGRYIVIRACMIG